MKYQTDYGELEIEEIIRCCNLWKKHMEKHNERKHAYNQTEEGRTKNRANAKEYYERKREEILQKRKEKYAAKKQTQEN